VAAGFYGLDGIEVVILYPKGKVSRVQELQLTTLGGNVTTLELHGTFDDCQALSKQALADPDLQARGHLTSANSINVARWLPQQFYYFFALKQWDGPPPVISVPSGNFGNLASGVLAHVAGLPVHSFIAACNANDVVPRFMQSKEYDPRPSITTLSNAMDVGSPSNFVRVLELFDNSFIDLESVMTAVSVSDQTTVDTIRDVYDSTGYVLDPHGAVGYRALADHLFVQKKSAGFFLETAHPVKFDSISQILGDVIDAPNAICDLWDREKQSIEMDVNYQDLRDLLLSKL
jgi:threonine synthase